MTSNVSSVPAPDVVVETLRTEKGRIAVQVTDAMYGNPFWSERFGGRGRVRAEEDAG